MDLDLSAAIEAFRVGWCEGPPARRDEAGVAAAAAVIAAQVAEQIAAETRALVVALQAMCDDEWLRRRDRIMRLQGAKYMRDSGAGEIEYAAYMVRRLIEGMADYDQVGSGGAYLTWLRTGRDEAVR